MTFMNVFIDTSFFLESYEENAIFFKNKINIVF